MKGFVMITLGLVTMYVVLTGRGPAVAQVLRAAMTGSTIPGIGGAITGGTPGSGSGSGGLGGAAGSLGGGMPRR